jgi:phosphatidylinositol alpha-1,6-mannosyltransferase
LLVAGSGVTAPVVACVAALYRRPAIALVHGLDLVASGLGYRSLADASLRRFEIVVANSHHTAALARSRGVLDRRIEVLHPGVEVPPSRTDPSAFCREYGLDGQERILLFAGRLVPRKGLRAFLERCLPEIVRRHPKVLLLVVGEVPRKSLSDRLESMDELQALVQRLQLDSHVRFLGRVSEEMLRAAYATADLLILPLREYADDVEGFGMVAVEAAAQGTPTVAFRVGGVADAVDHGRSGVLVEAGDDASFVAVINRALGDPFFLASSASCRQFAERFEWSRFGDRLLAICERAIRE